MSGFSVQDELERNPELRIQDLDSLREWLSKQPHLHPLSDSQLILFLHSCEYSLERTKKTIDTHYTIRAHAQEFFGDRDPQSPINQASLGIIELAILPRPDAAGNRYVFLRLQDTNPSHFVYCPLLTLHVMTTDLSLRLHGPEPGYVFLYDVRGATAAHAARLQLATLRKYFVYLQEAHPLRMKAIYLINCTPLIERVLQWVRPFIRSDIVNMLHLHSGPIEDLYRHVPKELLPKDYGGDQDSVHDLHEQLKQLMQSHRAWFLEDQQLKVDDSKRPGKGRSAGELFGMEGSFKQLDID